MILNLSIAIHRKCEESCLLEKECVSINIGPAINDKMTCELSNSDYLQHPNDLKPRYGWTYKGTEVRITSKKLMVVMMMVSEVVLI